VTMNGEFRNREEHAEIEAQLKRLRPIAPRLDLEAIIRESQDVPMAISPARRTAHPYRAIGLSWIGGAIAGAVLMYVGLAKPWAASPENESAPSGNDPAPIAEKASAPVVERGIAASAGGAAGAAAGDASLEVLQEPQAAPTPKRQASPPDGAALVLFALSDPRGSYPVAALRAGAHLTGVATTSNDAAPIDVDAPYPGETDSLRERRIELPPSPAITRGELMRRLREDASPWAL
jgi:hypothetical protein